MENNIKCHGKVMEFYYQISVGTLCLENVDNSVHACWLFFYVKYFDVITLSYQSKEMFLPFLVFSDGILC